VTVTAADVAAAVRRHYGIGSGEPAMCEWAVLDEVSLSVGSWTQGRIDLLVVRAWSGKPKGHERHAIEVKVSRSDFLREIKPPGPNAGPRTRTRRHGEAKYGAMRDLAHRAFYAAPAGIIRPAELPPGFGLLEVTDRGVRCAVQAPRRGDVGALPESVVVAILRRASTAEERLRRGAAGDPAERAAALAEHVRRLEAARQRDDERVERMRAAAVGLAQQLAQVEGASCRCGTRVEFRRRPGTRAYGEWRHIGEPGLVAPTWQPDGVRAPCDRPLPDYPEWDD
jgi:hypothetical protein